MLLKFRRFTLPYRRYIKYHLFGVKHFSRRLPKKGDMLWGCCPDPAVKFVESVSIFQDTIEYRDGTTDSLSHCGWQYYVPMHEGFL
jgi:hypothetical protein